MWRKALKKRTKTILRTVLLVFVAAVVGINVFLLNAASLGGDAVPMPFGVGATVVLTGSMEPALSAGDLLIVSKAEDYALRDIVVFQDGRIPVVHRIIRIDGEEIVTQGDANNTEDDPINREQIKGRVVMAIPLVGHVINLIKTPIGTLVIIAAAIFLLERSFRREKEKNSAEMDRIKDEIRALMEQQKKDLQENTSEEQSEKQQNTDQK